MNIIPALDIRHGRCVRLLYGDYDAETRYDIDPVDQARYYASMGLRQLHIVDLDGAKAGHPVSSGLIGEMVEAAGVAVQVGGGIRTEAHIQDLFDNGVSRVVIGSMAVKSQPTVRRWLKAFGPDRVVLALDVRLTADGQAMVTTDAWTETSAITIETLIDDYRDDGLRHVLCTDISRDGAMSGPSLALYQQLLRRYPDLQLQASGGVSSLADLMDLKQAGLPAAITGKALLDGKISAEELAQC